MEKLLKDGSGDFLHGAAGSIWNREELGRKLDICVFTSILLLVTILTIILVIYYYCYHYCCFITTRYYHVFTFASDIAAKVVEFPASAGGSKKPP